MPGGKPPASQPLPSREMILTDEVLLSVGNRPDIGSRWPFMKMRITAVKGCGRCGAKSARQTLYTEATRVKRNMASLPQVDRDELKRMLGATTLSFYLPTDHGVQKVTL
jgi:hypothetical protein